jgi:hypothetical protein
MKILCILIIRRRISTVKKNAPWSFSILALLPVAQTAAWMERRYEELRATWQQTKGKCTT